MLVEFYRAQVLISLAKNASMGANKLGPTDTRLAAVQKELRSIVTNNPNAILFGYQEFPSTTSCSSPEGCCGVRDEFTPPSANTQAVLQALTCPSSPASSCASTLDSRPIGAALDNARKVIDSRYRGERHLLLIVDGESYCPTVTGNQCDEAIIPQASLANSGVKITVVAVGPDVQNTGCLATKIAPAGRPLITATTPAELTAELDNFIREQPARGICTLSINNPQGLDTKTLEVSIDGQSILQEPEMGWSLIPGPTPKLQLNGRACALMQQVTDADNVDVKACYPQQ